ncbi:Bug family tripartite tricarboxylate transporter substrate binding protein [Dankookia sp. P2]|uniref:Bug family tripartite tricarboxylate transporter substrate binding protein n=1 Tax=Dankookia sp. P2 TaxID=3423955 RepID=UPI003D66A96A
MHTSRPIEVQGRFLGVAVTQAAHWRFIATDPAVEDLDGATFPARPRRSASSAWWCGAAGSLPAPRGGRRSCGRRPSDDRPGLPHPAHLRRAARCPGLRRPGAAAAGAGPHPGAVPMISRRLLLGAGLAAPFVAPARAQGFPERPVRYLVPYTPGATNDNVARTMARALLPKLGQPVVVENKAGAGGAVGARYVADARPDGHVLLNASAANLTIAPHLNAVGYDPVRSFAPVASAGEAFALVAVNTDLPIHSIAELIAHGRKHPGELNYASPGIGSVARCAPRCWPTRPGSRRCMCPSRAAPPRQPASSPAIAT